MNGSLKPESTDHLRQTHGLCLQAPGGGGGFFDGDGALAEAGLAQDRSHGGDGAGSDPARSGQ